MITIRLTRAPLLGCCLLFLAGCVVGHSPPARFYTLTPLESGGASATLSAKPLIVGPVSIPDYLNRPQIVTRSGANELVFAEFDRWGGALSSEISQALAMDISRSAGSNGFTVLPWQALPLNSSESFYRIPVEIARFDGVLGKEVVLQARWRLLLKQGPKEQTLLSRELTITERCDEESYEGVVAAMGRAVKKLGAVLSDGIRSSAPEKTP